MEGFKIGARVICVRTDGSNWYEEDDEFTIRSESFIDQQDQELCYRIEEKSNDNVWIQGNHFELVEKETKVMKPTDEISVEVSLAELAEIYLIMGFAHSSTEYKLWNYACDLFDSKQDEVDQLVYGKDEGQILNFRSYQDKIKLVMFPEPVETKTPQQIQIEQLQETIEKAAMQIKLLKGGN